MNDLPRQQLCKLIATYGRSLCDEPRRCEALLRDVCGQYRREISVLVGALKEGVAADLLASQNSVSHEVLLARLTRRLHDNLALAEDAARWAVESWALALGVISSAECQPSQPEPESPPRRDTPARKPETQPTDPSWSPSPTSRQPLPWKVLGGLGIAAVAIFTLLNYSRGTYPPQPPPTESSQPRATVSSQPEPFPPPTPQPPPTTGIELFKLRYRNGSLFYTAMLEMRGGSGIMRTRISDDSGHTQDVDQIMKLNRTYSPNILVLEGSNPVLAGTQVQAPDYSPDNIIFMRQSDGLRRVFNCDDAAVSAMNINSCVPVDVEVIRSASP